MDVEPRFSTIVENLELGDRFLSVWFASRCALRALTVMDSEATHGTDFNESDAWVTLGCVICSVIVSKLRADEDNSLVERARSSSQVTRNLVEENPPPVGGAIDAATLSAEAVFHDFPL
ncbi:hypothetical protein [Marimonas arenosa]|uniref:Uncharacterized protein n=1 Tax=Marimonas arenosa TaxID=1795305 RepID=A0AAE4B2S6_9RHOB|nr:hypothetical protein [Marimonas arenosa]MDQ2088582.1 hypothetical protein [Marimonas arenosa]